jgi:hypothetical protein
MATLAGIRVKPRHISKYHSGRDGGFRRRAAQSSLNSIIGVGIGIGVAIKIGMRKAVSESNPIAIPIPIPTPIELELTALIAWNY